MRLGLCHAGLAILLMVIMLFAGACGCGDDDDDDSTSPDDDTTDDDTGDDDVDDDSDDDDTGDDDTWPPLPDDDTDDDTGDDDTYPTTDGFEYIPAGTFSMGSPGTEVDHRDNEALHQVTLTNHFEVAATETTQDSFESLMGYNPSHFPIAGESPDRPVDQVSWYDALIFADKLSETKGFAPCFTLVNVVCADTTAGDQATYCKDNGGIWSADVTLNDAATIYECEGFRLPTEAEWEYAARAGTTTPFYNGAITGIGCSPVDPNLNAIAWYCANSNNYTRHVALKAPNDWGLYDMLGNVKEWTWDGYTASLSDATDPAESIDDHFRVVRGGAARWDGPGRLRAAYRKVNTPGRQDRFLGFRLVRTLPPDERSAVFHAPEPIDVPAPAAPSRALPTSLPFTYTRTDVGTPLTQQEIDDFTDLVTGFLKDADYFNYLRRMTHGMADDNPNDAPGYKLELQDFSASKSAGVVTYAHGGNSDNLMIDTGKIINNVSALYLATGDDTLGELLTDLCHGVQALFWGMSYDEEDPETGIMVRTVFPFNFTDTVDGRSISVTYDGAKHYSYDWNAHTVTNATNPYFGPTTWVRNWRSKDDVPHIFRTVPMLSYVAQDGEDASVRQAAEDALAALRGFAKDITDSGYHIRTKDEWGNAEVPINPDNGLVADLASFVLFDPLAPNGECDAKLSAALIGYGDPLDNDCNDGAELLYETVATLQHYYNYAIIRYFHLSALGLALVNEENDMAHDLLDGMAWRVDRMMNHEGQQSDAASWDADTAAYCVAAASYGLPLTSAEAQQVVEYYTKAANWYDTWGYWDPWDGSVADGGFPYEPSRNTGDGPVPDHEEFLYLFEYCQSPFRNADGADFIDCDKLLDPSQW